MSVTTNFQGDADKKPDKKPDKKSGRQCILVWLRRNEPWLYFILER